MEMSIGLVILAATLLWVIITYNRFITLRRYKDEAWSGVAVQLKRRHDLAPNLFSLVTRYAEHEKNLLEEIARQRSVMVGGPQQVVNDEKQYAGTLKQIFALGEAYPQLRANENFLSLQQTLNDIEEQLQLARRYFNGTVRQFNILVESFPSLVLARLFNFKSEMMFELDDPDEAKNPRME